MGAVELEEGARQLLQDTVARTLGALLAAAMSMSLVHALPRRKPIEVGDGADMLVAGRRGYGALPGACLVP